MNGLPAEGAKGLLLNLLPLLLLGLVGIIEGLPRGHLPVELSPLPVELSPLPPVRVPAAAGLVGMLLA